MLAWLWSFYLVLNCIHYINNNNVGQTHWFISISTLPYSPCFYNILVPYTMSFWCSRGGNMNNRWPMKKRSNSAVSMWATYKCSITEQHIVELFNAPYCILLSFIFWATSSDLKYNSIDLQNDTLINNSCRVI